MQSNVLIGQAKFVRYFVLICRAHTNPPVATIRAGLTASHYKPLAIGIGVHWSIWVMGMYHTFNRNRV
jgi:hypothetical protein